MHFVILTVVIIFHLSPKHLGLRPYLGDSGQFCKTVSCGESGDSFGGEGFPQLEVFYITLIPIPVSNNS